MTKIIMNDLTETKVHYNTFWYLATSGRYKYTGYNKEYKGHQYVLIDDKAYGYPIMLIDENTTRRV